MDKMYSISLRTQICFWLVLPVRSELSNLNGRDPLWMSCCVNCPAASCWTPLLRCAVWASPAIVASDPCYIIPGLVSFQRPLPQASLALQTMPTPWRWRIKPEDFGSSSRTVMGGAVRGPGACILTPQGLHVACGLPFGLPCASSLRTWLTS